MRKQPSSLQSFQGQVVYERFTDRARKVMMLAHRDALRRRATAIDTEHILLGLLEEGQGVAAHVLRGLGVDWESVAAALAARGQPDPPPPTSDAPGEWPFSAWQLPAKAVRRFFGSRADKLSRTAESSRLIECAMQEARALGHNFVGTEHLLLGLLHQPNTLAAQLLVEQGVTLDGVRREVLGLIGRA
jgi:ATP-dependent Clp protease ATP-binding subunit ClpC